MDTQSGVKRISIRYMKLFCCNYNGIVTDGQMDSDGPVTSFDSKYCTNA